MMKSVCPLVIIFALAACAVTTQQPLSDLEKAPRSGFLSDYSLLQPGKKGEPRLRYVDPNGNWNSYTGIFVEPVVFISDADANIDPKVEKVLSSYFYNALKTHLSGVLPIVEQPGPHVLIVRARVINAAQSLATDSYSFVGSARGEFEFKDGGSGQTLAEAVDGRSGGMSIKNAGVWQWGDAENVMEYWADLAAKRLTELQSGASAS